MNFFQSDIIILSKLIKNNNFDKAYDYMSSISENNYPTLQELINQIIFSWIKIEKSNLNFSEANEVFQQISPRYKNIKKINDVFLNCYFDTKNAEAQFKNLVNDQNTDFSRYTFFLHRLFVKKRFAPKSNFSFKSKIIRCSKKHIT